jgi:AcrR family transcriptional regulator
MSRPKESERKGKLQKTRGLLLEAAAEEFAREGYMGANINRISMSAGFAKGTIYNYFSSKRKLMLALIDEVAYMHVTFILQQVQEEEDPVRRLARFFEAGFKFVEEHLPQSQTMINTLYSPDLSFKMHTYRAYQPLFQLISRDIVTAGISQGEFRQIEPDPTAILLMTIYMGTSSHVDTNGRTWLDPLQVADFALHALRNEAFSQY